jgi:DNA-binding CsgD family transcriptional regulator
MQEQRERNYARKRIAGEIASLLLSGSSCGVVIVGEHGSGKSFVAHRALERIREHSLVLGVRGSAIASKLPYGALSVLLNELELSSLENPILVSRGITQLLHEKAKGRPVVLFVDNAHDLDDLSAMTIAQLSAGGHVRLLAACLDLPHVGGDIMGLWKDDMLRRVDLGPFTIHEASETLSLEFGNRFSHKAVRTLWAASGGNPLFLQAMAREEIDRGTLTLVDDSWVLDARVVAHSGEIGDIVRARISKLTAGQRDAFELLALAGPLPLLTIMKAASPDDVDALQECGFIKVDGGAIRTVSVASDVMAEVAAAIVPPGRSAELKRRLQSTLPQGEHSWSSGAKAVEWALGCGEEVEVEAALAAAHSANESSNPEAALKYIQEIPDRHMVPAAAMAEARAHISLNSLELAHRIVTNAAASTDAHPGPEEWLQLHLLRVETALRGEPQGVEPEAILKTIEDRLAESSGSELGPTALNALACARTEVAIFEGRHAQVLEGLRASGGPAADALSIRMTAARFEAEAVAGDVMRAMDMARTLMPLTLDRRLPDATAAGLRKRLLEVYLMAGHINDAEALLEWMTSSREPQSRLGNLIDLGQGLVFLHKGRLAEARSSLGTGMAQLRREDGDELADLAGAAYAFACSLQGLEEEAGAYLSELGRQRRAASWLEVRLTRFYELSARAQMGQRVQSVRAMALEAEADARLQRTLAVLLFLSAAARLGERQTSVRLAGSSSGVNGSFARLCRRFAQGIKDSDTDLLLSVSKEAEGMGNVIFAHDAALKAVSAANDSGNRALLRTAQRTLQALDELLGGRRNGESTLAASILTAREREVASRAAAGISNRKIAEQMHVSVRTVEGHLYQVYAKLHVASRSELKEVVAGEAATARMGR